MSNDNPCDDCLITKMKVNHPNMPIPHCPCQDKAYYDSIHFFESSYGTNGVKKVKPLDDVNSFGVK